MDCNSDQCHLIFHTIIPTMGVLTAAFIFLSPMRTVNMASAAKSLKGINPDPFPFMIMNCFAWIFYGLYSKDNFVISCNIFGYLLGTYYTLVSYGLANEGESNFRRSAQITILPLSTYVLVGSWVAFQFVSDQSTSKTILGVITVTLLVAFYVSPLSEMYQVIKKRDSSTIDPLLACACFLNGSLWTIYALFIADPFIWIPNGLGVILSAAQIVLRLVYRRTPEKPELKHEDTMI